MINNDDINASSFENFYKTYYDRVFRYLLRKTGRYQDAEDLTGEIFVYCYQNFSSYDSSKSAISTWLYTIVNSRFKNYCRDRRVNMDYDDLENLFPMDYSDMERSVWLEQLRIAMTNEIQKLSEREQKIVILKYFKKKSSEEIASIMGLSPGNVRVILSRALDKMKPGLERFMI